MSPHMWAFYAEIFKDFKRRNKIKAVTKFQLFKGIPWNYNRNRKNVEDTFLVCKKVQKKDKSEFVIKSVGNIVRIIFIQNYLSNC